jgi:NADP-dependent 3-hydroxy acid dehydrogenase YdfG
VNQIALVTGAGSGIGRAAGVALADAGFTVVLTGRRHEPLQEAAEAAGNGAFGIACDVRDPAIVSTCSSTMRVSTHRASRWRNWGSTTGPPSSRPT